MSENLNVSTQGGNPPEQPTIRDVARAAGVSVATVSNAFNKPERLASATRERVLQTAATLRYSGPNPAARALRLGRRGAIAIATAGQAEEVFRDPAINLVARGIARACDQAGVALLTGGRGAPHADAVAFVKCAPAEHVALPTVIVDGPEIDGHSVIAASVREAARDVAAHLVALGHRRVAILGNVGSDDRLNGALDGWSNIGDAAGYRTDELSREHGEAAARAALTGEPRPTAILALHDVLAWGALDAAYRAGLRVPEDVSIAGIDDLPGSEALGLTTAFVPYQPMGDLAGMLLAALIDGEQPEVPPPFPVAPVMRRTTGPAPAD